MHQLFSIWISWLIANSVVAFPYVVPDYEAEQSMHPSYKFKTNRLYKRAVSLLKFNGPHPSEDSFNFWNDQAQHILDQQLLTKTKLNTNMAQNLIMFLGDGLSISTIAAGRVYLGGEEKQFNFEKFPYTGLSKTYCANSQVADSACSATAYLCGVKANFETIGVTADVELNDCLAQNNSAYHVSSLADWAQKHGMATGLITTTTVTHASPAGIYAHTSNRNWEYDAEVLNDKGDLDICPDIASQLINGPVGRKLNVIMGGGRSHFLPLGQKDVNGTSGKRLDGTNLIEQWREQHDSNSYYIQTKGELLKLPKNTERVLGLFAAGHMPYHLDIEAKALPTLSDMVAVGLDILIRQSKGRGFFLFVEGGRIDHAHHDTWAKKALDETVEFDKAIEVAQKRTNEENTLTVVTSDHSHTMTFSGYSNRKNDILGISDGMATDGLPYATLSYANGPGYANNLINSSTMSRKELQQVNMKDNDYRFPATVPLAMETHGGDDVAVFARGPYSHLFTGVYEQNFIPHAMAYASCVGSKKTACNNGLRRENLFNSNQLK